MIKQNVIVELSFDFALKIIELYKKLTENREFVISKQLLRSGTSIGANIEEAEAGFTKKEFIYKMSIAAKEARETRYWLKILQASKLFGLDYSTYLHKVDSIIKVLTKIIKSSQESHLKFNI